MTFNNIGHLFFNNVWASNRTSPDILSFIVGLLHLGKQLNFELNYFVNAISNIL